MSTYRVYQTAFWILVGLIALSPIIYTFTLNQIGPSTEYHDPRVPTAVRGPDGRDYVYLGDEFYVNITVVRHKLNGNCRFVITRYAEKIGGPEDGKAMPISYAELQFVGQNELRQARWPSPPDKYILGYAVDEDNNYVLTQPLLPDGVDEQEFVMYVKGRYYCNFLDYLIPRYIQGGEKPNETARVRVVVRRHKP